MGEEFTVGEIEVAIDAAGRRNIWNWDELPEHSRLQVRQALKKLALEWLRAHRPVRTDAACQGSARVLPAWGRQYRDVAHRNPPRAA